VDFHVFAGNEKVNISTVTETIRNEDFNILCINGNRTSITDKMGEIWSAWMIIRELWCNALDEGGHFREVTETVIPEENCTNFYIQVVPEIRAVLDNWTKYFVHDIEPVYSNDALTIYPGGENLRLYKNGVLIKETKDKSFFCYDLKSASINELREYNDSVDYFVFQCITKGDKKTATLFLEGIKEDHYEANMYWDWYDAFAEGWKEAIGNAKLIHQKAVDSIRERGLEIDIAATIIVPEKIYTALTKQFKGIGALRVADKVNEFYETYSADADEKIKSALVILEEAGYNFSPELKFVYGVFGDKNVWAKISMDKKEVLISENIADKSLFDVITTLIEENEHFKTGFSDKTREFQQHFIDLYANKLLKLAKIEL
jgi:hypothetical protein